MRDQHVAIKGDAVESMQGKVVRQHPPGRRNASRRSNPHRQTDRIIVSIILNGERAWTACG